MFPLRDENPTSSFAWMTIVLIAANVIVFLYQLLLPEPAVRQFILAAGFVPARLFAETPTPGLPPLLTLFTSQFLHGGLLHLGGNMLFLWIFGNNVEDELGSFRFLVFYLLCGVAAALFHTATGPSSSLPTIGASGAISGVLGAYALLFPRARIHTAVILIFYFSVVPIPALIWVGIWLLLQLVQGLATQGVGGGVAWFAHIGGLIGGVVLLSLFRPRRPRPKMQPFSGSIFR